MTTTTRKAANSDRDLNLEVRVSIAAVQRSLLLLKASCLCLESNNTTEVIDQPELAEAMCELIDEMALSLETAQGQLPKDGAR